MELRHAIGEFVDHGRELLDRLRSAEEGPTATAVDLHILRVQLFLLDHEAANREQACILSALPKAANLQELKVQHPSQTMTEIEDKMPRLEDPSLPPIIAPIIPPAEPV